MRNLVSHMSTSGKTRSILMDIITYDFSVENAKQLVDVTVVRLIRI